MAPLGEALCADLENGPWPLARPHLRRRWSSPTICGGRCFPSLLQSVAAGGVLIYETFAAGNETVGKPSRPEFLLQPGELLRLCEGLHVVAFEDGYLDNPARFIQRIAAVRRFPDRALPRYRL